ncbi:MAG: phosphopantetheine-binding protein, partial [bacterium]
MLPIYPQNPKKLPGFEKIRRDLQKRLPHYMIPARFIRLEKLPLTPTGKVDRQRLPAPELGRPEMKTPYVAPRNELETDLTLLCEEILDVHPIGIRDQFIDLGADSFKYVLLSVEIEKRYGHPFPLQRFLDDPTVEHLADVLGSDHPKESKEPSNHPWTRASFRRLDDNTCLKRLAKQVIFHSMMEVGWALPYGLMNRTIAWFCDRAWVQKSFLTSKAHPLSELFPFLNCSTGEK